MIIAIDAAGTELGIAACEPDGSPIADDAWASKQRQSAEILPRLLDLLARAGRDLKETSGVAVGTGPGSFTGLRVAMALGKGLAVGLGRPLIGIGSLHAWLEAAPDADAAVARAGAREAFALVRGEAEPVVLDADEVTARLRDRLVVAPDELASAFGLERAVPPRGAPEIARRAAERLARGEGGDDVRTLEPAYLRAPRGLPEGERETVRWL